MSFQPLESTDSILAAAARCGLHLVEPTLDTSGLDFAVVHARDAEGLRWIVRAPRRPEVATTARREARVLAAVRARLGPSSQVAVPDWRIVDDVIAYPRLPGTPLVTLDTGAPVWNFIDPAAPAPAFLEQVGALLATMQLVPRDELPQRTIADERREVARINGRAAALLSPPAGVLARWERWAGEDALWPTHTALVHADLHPGHLLLDEQARICGVLDWTEAHVGDPANDFAMMHRCFGRSALEAIVAAFAAHGGVTWPGLVEHAIARADWFPAAAADWADRAGNAAILEMARTHLAQQLAASSS